MPYCGVTAADVPLLFISETVTELTDPVPWMLNGTVSVNWLPVALDAEFPYHEANADASGTVISLCASVTLEVGAKWNRPLTISLDGIRKLGDGLADKQQGDVSGS